MIFDICNMIVFLYVNLRSMMIYSPCEIEQLCVHLFNFPQETFKVYFSLLPVCMNTSISEPRAARTKEFCDYTRMIVILFLQSIHALM